MDAETKLSISNLREHFDLVIASNEERWKIVERTHKETLRVALEANDKRLGVLNGFREAMADQSSRMLTRVEADSNRNAILEKIEGNRATMEGRLEAEIKPLQTRMEQLGRPNWALMTSVASAAFMVIAAVWMIIGLKIDATVSPLALEMGQVRGGLSSNTDRIAALTNQATASTASDGASRADRDQLNVRVRAMEGANASRRTEQSVIEARMAEVETQFCSRDIISNLMHATDLRMMSMLWRKVFIGSVFPTDNSFYPKVCNQNVLPQKAEQQ